ncbi:MAG: HEAT repeat domain-containing protein [Planctomycetes bacterium]|nr:HEAT repeat domain-containing protein [Planctomycetota bacterium]
MPRTLRAWGRLGLAALLAAPLGCGSGAPKDAAAAPAQPAAEAVKSAELAPMKAIEPASPAPEPATVVQGPTVTKVETPAPAVTGSYPELIEKLKAQIASGEFGPAHRLCSEMLRTFYEPEQQNQLRDLSEQLRDYRASAGRALAAIQSLKATGDARKHARVQLLSMGEVAHILLAQALKDTDIGLAAQAAELLGKRRDPRAVEALLQRLNGEPPPELRGALLTALASFGRAIPADQIPKLYEQTKGDDAKFERRDLVGVLATAWATTAGGDAERFGRMAGDAEAGQRLKAYVERAYASGLPDIVAWAEAHLGDVGIYQPGLWGQFFEGRNFEKQLHEKLCESVNHMENNFPFPDGRQEEFSARWTGFLKVDAAGTYTFYSTTDDGSRLYLGEKLVLDDWNLHGTEERQVQVELQPGMHALKYEFFQGGGGAVAKLEWQRPGGARELVGVKDVRCPPKKEQGQEEGEF